MDNEQRRELPVDQRPRAETIAQAWADAGDAAMELREAVLRACEEAGRRFREAIGAGDGSREV